MSFDALTTALAEPLGRDDRILLAYVFGSVARGDASEASDIDVAVLGREELGADAVARLCEVLSGAIDYRRSVEVVDLRP